MLVTIVMDTFTKAEFDEIASAIEECCSVKDAYGFSSAAVYCFWNPRTKEILYVGLSRVIAVRIMQHLGLIECEADCCKRDQIKDYYKYNDKIGLTLLLQSPMEQPFSKDARKALLKEFSEETVRDIEQSMDGSENVSFTEGMLIGLHFRLGDKLPPWNKIQGSKEGFESLGRGTLSKRLIAVQRILAGEDIDEIENQNESEGPLFEHLDYLTYEHITPMHAHCTLREMAKNPTWTKYEELLHAVRMRGFIDMNNFNQNLDALSRMHAYYADTVQEMMKEKYLIRYPWHIPSLKP